MANKPWMDSSGLIDSVKRKISIPINQRTFTDEIILAFASEEMMISMVPDILLYHEEYFVADKDVALVSNQLNYPIPERALGARLRDLWYKDVSGTLHEMTRISPDDKAYWNTGSGGTGQLAKYYLKDTDVVLASQPIFNATGSLQFSYFRRPGMLTTVDRAAIARFFVKTLTVSNATIVAGDTITIGSIIFTAVSGIPSQHEFQIGGSSVDTASNLATSITSDGINIASNGSPSTEIVEIKYDILSLSFSTSNSVAFSINSSIGIQFTGNVPGNLSGGSVIDFLQTKPGHKTLKESYKLPLNSVSVDIITLPAGVIPDTFIVGDYLCSEYECIIPQIPADLHSGLAERVCNRILASMGDDVGLAINDSKLQKVKGAEGTILDNRVDGAPQKINQRKSLLRYMQFGYKRRF